MKTNTLLIISGISLSSLFLSSCDTPEGQAFTIALTRAAFTIFAESRPGDLLATLIPVGFSANRNGKLQILTADLREASGFKTQLSPNRGSESRLQTAMAHVYQTA